MTSIYMGSALDGLLPISLGLVGVIIVGIIML